ncbi:hypothetical protein HMPREF9946_03166 [Acetobacteraceae bacterium AT-5844]|nr:hypothetical protein HMPREF9946_03166 [Acetobacteraceae bacterium AT-5844]
MTCRECGRTATKTVEEWALQHRLDSRLSIWQATERLRCGGCGRRGPNSEIKER